jgi:plasmid stability protein
MHYIAYDISLKGVTMTSLQVRDLPDQIYDKLKKEAKKKHRSLAQQTVITLAKGLDTSYNPKEKRALLLENLSKDKLNNKKYRLTDPVKIIREDRER